MNKVDRVSVMKNIEICHDNTLKYKNYYDNAKQCKINGSMKHMIKCNTQENIRKPNKILKNLQISYTRELLVIEPKEKLEGITVYAKTYKNTS